MNRVIVRALVVAALVCLAGRVSAQITLPTSTFTTVDAVKAEYSRIHITGIVEGEDAPRTVTFHFSSSATSLQATCERLALLAMTKPGQHVLKVQVSTTWVYSCALARVAP